MATSASDAMPRSMLVQASGPEECGFTKEGKNGDDKVVKMGWASAHVPGNMMASLDAYTPAKQTFLQGGHVNECQYTKGSVMLDGENVEKGWASAPELRQGERYVIDTILVGKKNDNGSSRNAGNDSIVLLASLTYQVEALTSYDLNSVYQDSSFQGMLVTVLISDDAKSIM